MRAEERVEHLLGDDHATHGNQDLLQVLAVDRRDHHALEGKAEQSCDADRERDCGDYGGEIEPHRIRLHPSGERDEHQRRHVGADRDEGAMPEVEHVHQAEDEREAGSHHEDHHAHREPRNRQRHPRRARGDKWQRGERERHRQQQRQVVHGNLRQRRAGLHVCRAH